MNFFEDNGECKIIKLIDGSTVLCRLIEESETEYIIERPMLLVVESVVDKELNLIPRIQLQKWVNFTSDLVFNINKDKVLVIALLDDEMTMLYNIYSQKVVDTGLDKPESEPIKDLSSMDDNELMEDLFFQEDDKFILH